MLILLFLTGKNEISNIKDKMQTQLQILQQLHAPATQPFSTPFTDYHPLWGILVLRVRAAKASLKYRLY